MTEPTGPARLEVFFLGGCTEDMEDMAQRENTKQIHLLDRYIVKRDLLRAFAMQNALCGMC